MRAEGEKRIASIGPDARLPAGRQVSLPVVRSSAEQPFPNYETGYVTLAELLPHYLNNNPFPSLPIKLPIEHLLPRP